MPARVGSLPEPSASSLTPSAPADGALHAYTSRHSITNGSTATHTKKNQNIPVGSDRPAHQAGSPAASSHDPLYTSWSTRTGCMARGLNRPTADSTAIASHSAPTTLSPSDGSTAPWKTVAAARVGAKSAVTPIWPATKTWPRKRCAGGGLPRQAALLSASSTTRATTPGRRLAKRRPSKSPKIAPSGPPNHTSCVRRRRPLSVGFRRR